MISGSANQLYKMVSSKDEALSNVDKVTEGVSHIIADEIIHSSEAADLIRFVVIHPALMTLLSDGMNSIKLPGAGPRPQNLATKVFSLDLREGILPEIRHHRV